MGHLHRSWMCLSAAWCPRAMPTERALREAVPLHTTHPPRQRAPHSEPRIRKLGARDNDCPERPRDLL